MAAPSSRPATPSVPLTDPGASSFGNCGNCGASLAGRFCSECGEKKLTRRDYSLGHFVAETIDGLTHLDSKFFRTLRALLTRPGELSNAFFLGGRSRYTKPLSLFIIINVVFFFIQPFTGAFGFRYANYMTNPRYRVMVEERLRDTGETNQQYGERFNADLQHQKKSLLIFAVPFLALCMLIVFAGTGRTYAEHLVFAVQTYAFLLVFLAMFVLVVLFPVLILLPKIWPVVGTTFSWLKSERTVDLLLFFSLMVYMYLGFRRAYNASRARAAISGLILAGAAVATIGAYNIFLFYVTFWTT